MDISAKTVQALGRQIASFKKMPRNHAPWAPVLDYTDEKVILLAYTDLLRGLGAKTAAEIGAKT